MVVPHDSGELSSHDALSQCIVYVLVGDVGRVASAALWVVVHELDFQPELPSKLSEPIGAVVCT